MSQQTNILEGASVSPEIFQDHNLSFGKVLSLRLSQEVTFRDIFSGAIPISTETKIFDRHGAVLDTAELIAQMDTVEVAHV